MSHRGRLNTLANIFGKSTNEIFSEFEGKDYEEEEDFFDGDVKYHLGWTSKRETDSGVKINLNLAPNPSHLESVVPVVQGITRAKIENELDNKNTNVVKEKNTTEEKFNTVLSALYDLYKNFIGLFK